MKLADVGDRVEVTRRDETKVFVNVTQANYLGFVGRTDEDEVVVAYNDNTEAPPVPEGTGVYLNWGKHDD